jgi:hypothetical protein
VRNRFNEKDTVRNRECRLPREEPSPKLVFLDRFVCTQHDGESDFLAAQLVFERKATDLGDGRMPFNERFDLLRLNLKTAFVDHEIESTLEKNQSALVDLSEISRGIPFFETDCAVRRTEK